MQTIRHFFLPNACDLFISVRPTKKIPPLFTERGDLFYLIHFSLTSSFVGAVDEAVAGVGIVGVGWVRWD